MTVLGTIFIGIGVGDSTFAVGVGAARYRRFSSRLQRVAACVLHRREGDAGSLLSGGLSVSRAGHRGIASLGGDREVGSVHRDGLTDGAVVPTSVGDGITSRYDNRTIACAGFRYSQREVFISCAVVINREIIRFKGSHQCSYCRIGRIRLGEVCTASHNFMLRKLF